VSYVVSRACVDCRTLCSSSVAAAADTADSGHVTCHHYFPSSDVTGEKR